MTPGAPPPHPAPAPRAAFRRPRVSTHPCTRLVLLRHGETPLNKDGRFRGRTDPPLTPAGEQQARSVVPLVIDLEPVALFTSPRLRARQTLAPARAALGLEAQVDSELDDLDYGDWAGKTAQQAAAEWPTLFATWQRDPGAVHFPGGESVLTAVNRITAFVARASQAHPGATVLAVTHDAIVRVAVCVVLGAPLAATHRIAVDLASTTALLCDPPRLLWMNIGLPHPRP